MEKFFDFSFMPKLKNTESLYYRADGFERKSNTFVAVGTNNFISFNTYFNSISIAKIRNYTAVTELIFHMETSGSFEIQIISAGSKGETQVNAQSFAGNGYIAVRLSEIPQDSILLYPILRAKDIGNSIHKISVFAKSQTVRNLNCAIIICTCKREEYLISNINCLLEKRKSHNGFQYKVLVIDNGKTLSRSDFPDGVLLFFNENTGGSGGFSRGMEEAVKIGGFTHLILMDDDIFLDFISVQKMINFLRFLKQEWSNLSVSGSMLYLDKPTRQFEAGGYFTQDGLQKGFGHFLDLKEAEALLENEADHSINYGGWWFMCIPVDYVSNGNFPKPFFLKYDDVEYSLRCKLKIVTLNGVGVWHQRFEDKYNSSSEYYNIRNYLYLCSLHCRNFDRQKAKKIARKRFWEKLLRQQYKMADAVLLGYRDFRKGLKYLENLDAAENHRKVCSLDYEMVSYDVIKAKYGFRPEDGVFYPPPEKKGLWNLKALLPKKYIFTDGFQDYGSQYLGARIAVHCNPACNRGYVSKGSLKEFLKGIFKIFFFIH